MSGAVPEAVFDVHAHAMPGPFVDWLADRGLASVDAGAIRLDPVVSGVGAGARIPFPDAMHDPEARLKLMDDLGVTHQAVSAAPFVLGTMSPDESLVCEILGHANDALAAYVASAPDRLYGLGAVPVGFPTAAAEAERCLDELGMTGLAIGSRGAGRELDDPVNEDLWALAAERGVLIFLHPSASVAPARTSDYWLTQLAGYPMETALAASRLVFGGVLERHDLTICLAHGGGCLGSLRGRLDLGWRRKAEARTVPLPPSAYLDRFHYDTALFSPSLLRQLIADVGSDHVLLGTDFPFDLADTEPLPTLDRLGVSSADRRRIQAGNALALLAPRPR